MLDERFLIYKYLSQGRGERVAQICRAVLPCSLQHNQCIPGVGDIHPNARMAITDVVCTDITTILCLLMLV